MHQISIPANRTTFRVTEQDWERQLDASYPAIPAEALKRLAHQYLGPKN
jgi:hypothetical protein